MAKHRFFKVGIHYEATKFDKFSLQAGLFTDALSVLWNIQIDNYIAIQV
jgi:hypothetical protein